MVLSILIVILMAFLGTFIFSPEFRTWISDSVEAIGLLLGEVFVWVRKWVRRYVYFVLVMALAVLGLIIWALLTSSPTFSAFLFVLAICLVILTWLPAGVILRLFRVTDAVIPRVLREFVAWVAFVGWLSLMCPEVLTMKSLLGAALVGFIFFGTCTKIKVLDRIIAPIVIVMCLYSAVWSFFWPESFRSNTQFVESGAKRVQSIKDRISRENETYAATTYAVTLRDIVALYKCTHDTVLTDVAVDTVKRGTIVKLVSRKKEIKVIDEQGFVEIQLANKKGLFVGGQNKYYVEAEFVQLATPRDITPKEDLKDLLKKQTPTNVSEGQKVGGMYTVGEHQLALKNGEESDWCTIQPCHAYGFVKNPKTKVTLIYEDGTTANSWGLRKWPDKYKFKVKNLSNEMPVLRVV